MQFSTNVFRLKKHDVFLVEELSLVRHLFESFERLLMQYQGFDEEKCRLLRDSLERVESVWQSIAFRQTFLREAADEFDVLLRTEKDLVERLSYALDKIDIRR